MRTFLFLQGPSSPLFSKCAAALEARGHTCLHINLNVGDWIFWRRRGGTNYRGRPERWPQFVRDFMIRNGVTDLLLLGEERPYHKTAVAAAKALGIDVYVIELGYLRPDWVTLERDGMSSNSHFPREPQRILAEAEGLPEPDWTVRYRQSFTVEACCDLLYNLPNVFLWFLYPHYRRHGLFHPLAEYAGWILRLLRKKRTERDAQETCDRLLASGQPFFIYPLQLQTDYQLRAHSPFASQQEAITLVLASFAAHAANDGQLLVKLHPLDNGLIDWRACVEKEAQRHGIGGRVHVIDGGNLDRLIDSATGLVTVNSTAVLGAFKRHKPVKTLGAAVFDTPGLSYPASLDAFWGNPYPAEKTLEDAFFRLIAAKYQVRGNFFSDAGTSAAAEAIAQRLVDEKEGDMAGAAQGIAV
ncbi:capsule biosynthesis protein [Shinella zoogloeoides]|uniref:capsule biosynthesis protein n=1 Tax=Shinella zoogloeoides TaxID=352475 RepID=UPI00273DDA4D|nr:capsular biosynthesis protein [Shinella zoogloeoides]WLR93288.1 capsular biosynthesis protein [Shinella zoogloeoides]